jgi:antitoxin YefM
MYDRVYIKWYSEQETDVETLTATRARKELFKLLKRSVRGHRQFRIRHKEGDIVLLSEEDYDALLETLELLSTPGLLKSIRRARQEIARGETYPLEEILGTD